MWPHKKPSISYVIYILFGHAYIISTNILPAEHKIYLTNTYTHPGLAIQVLKFITVGRDILYVYKYVNAVHRAAYSLCGMYTV